MSLATKNLESRTPSLVTAAQEDQGALAQVANGLASRQTGYELVAPSGERLPVPAPLFVVLRQAATALDRGDAVAVVPVSKLLTTQQAADLLNVSRQYLVRLLDEGRLPFSRTGSHRRLKAVDVLAFKAQRDRNRTAKLDELTQLSEELGGYDELGGDGVVNEPARS